jgi:hypothetical protein
MLVLGLPHWIADCFRPSNEMNGPGCRSMTIHDGHESAADKSRKGRTASTNAAFYHNEEFISNDVFVWIREEYQLSRF